MTTTTRRKPADPFDVSHLVAESAERQVLAGLLDILDREYAVAVQIVTELASEMFSGSATGDVFNALAASIKATAHATRADVLGSLRRAGHEQGTDAYLLFVDLVEDRLGAGSQSARLAREAAAEIRQLHERRRAVEAAALVAKSGGHPDDITTLVNHLERVRAAGDGASARRWSGLVSMLDAWAKDKKEPCVPTLFGPLDRRMGGGLAIGLTGIAARPGIGKSALAAQLVLGALLHDPEISAVWFRGEMTNDLLSRRLLAAWSGIRAAAVPVVTTNDSARRSKAAREAAVDLAGVIGDRLKVVDPPLSPEVIESEIRTHLPRLVVVDYLQLCESSGKADRRAEVEYVIRQLATLADRYQVAFLIVSAIAGDRKKTSGIGMIAKETNLLDYSAHAMISLWADEAAEDLKRPDPYPVEMRIEKNRTGPVGQVDLFFTGSGQYFTAADAEEQLLDDGYDEFAAFAPGASR